MRLDRRFRTLLWVGLAVLIAVPVEGQGRRGGPSRAQMQEQIQQRIDNVIQERLELDDDTMAELSTVLRRFQRRRMELGRDRQRALTKVRMLGQEDLGGAPLTAETASETLADLVRLSEEEASLFREEQEALLELLTPVQLLQLVQVREEVNARIRRMRGGDGRGPAGAMPPEGFGLPGRW